MRDGGRRSNHSPVVRSATRPRNATSAALYLRRVLAGKCRGNAATGAGVPQPGKHVVAASHELLGNGGIVCVAPRLAGGPFLRCQRRDVLRLCEIQALSNRDPAKTSVLFAHRGESYPEHARGLERLEKRLARRRQKLAERSATLAGASAGFS